MYYSDLLMVNSNVNSNMINNSIYNKIKEVNKLISKFNSYHNKSVPLCAAENIISPFCKLPLSGNFQERYIMNNSYSYQKENNFVGSEYLLPFYKLISEQCKILFDAKYSDARTMSGMNCLTTLLMSITNISDDILILGDNFGGHASVKDVCNRLGLETHNIPYNINNYDIDYPLLNKLIQKHKIPYVLLAPSDILFPLDIDKINLQNTVLLYDISQLLGLIAGKLIKNPLSISDNIVVFGGTHKTLPGPTSGLIMTNNKKLHKKIESNINPKFLRNTQMNQKISLLFSLIEAEKFGYAYQKRIVETSNKLGEFLYNKGFNVVKKEGKYSLTHQIFIKAKSDIVDNIYKNSILYGVTLNKKNKDLFDGHGIRIGTQEISRYKWDTEALHIISNLLFEFSKQKTDARKINALINSLPPKIIHYTFSDDLIYFLHKN